MSTFAVTNSTQLLDSVNYLLSNLSTGNAAGNITVPEGTLVANVTTGEIVPLNVPGGTVYGYVNQYINLRYATSPTGSTGFSTVPLNATYFGVFNSATPTPSTNPAAYQWREVAGGFGTTKTIYYSAIGGRQILFAAASSPPSSNYVISVANVAIDLDVVTTAAGTPGERGPIAMAYVVTTADPNTATSAQLTGWFEAARDAGSPPIGTGLTPVAGDTATFIYGAGAGTPSGTFSYNGSTWNLVIGQVISGNVIVANSLPGSAILPASIFGNRIAFDTILADNMANATITGDKIAANTVVGNNLVAGTITSFEIAANTIVADNIAGGTITGSKIAANTIVADNIAASTITSTQIAANTIVADNIAAGTITGSRIAANTITGNNISANTITATQISSDYVYAGNIVSFGAQQGNINSTGYWLEYQTGNARFGGNVSIGNNLSVAGLITTGSLDANTVNTNQLLVNSATTVLFQGSPGASVFYPVSYFNTTGNTVWPANTRGFAVPAVAIRPTTEGSTNGSSMLVTLTSGVQCDTDNQFNLVELWRTGAAVSYSNVFNSVSLATANNSSVTNNEQMVIVGSKSPGLLGPGSQDGVTLFSSDGGDTWGFGSDTQGSPFVDASQIQINNSDGQAVDRLTQGGLVTSTNTVGGPNGSWFTPTGTRLSSSRVLFTGLEVGNVNINNDIGIVTGQTAFTTVFRPFNFSSPGPATQTQLTTPTGVFSDIYDMDWGYASTGNTTVKNAVFVCTGGDVLTTQFQYHTGNSNVTNSTMQLRNAPTDSNLFSVSCDRGTNAPTAFVAVGEAGVVVRSTDNGATWTSISTPAVDNLRGVIGFGGEATKRFVAVGDDQTIIMSSDGGLTWTAATVPTPTDGRIRNLNSVSFCPTAGTGGAGLWTAVGEGVIYKCDKTSTTWSIYYQDAAVVSGDIQRLVYIGSNPDVYTNTIASSAQSIGNTVVSYNYQDTNYDDNTTYQYYLVIGNMNSAAGLTARFPSLTVQEIKR